MRIIPLAFAWPFLAALSLTGCHRSQPQMTALPGTEHPAYTITDLGAGMPHDINNRGQVVGMYAAGVFPGSKGSPYFHGCLWEQGERIEMPTLGGWYSDVGRVTEGGQVIGSASVRGHDAHGLPLDHGCVWDGVKLTDLEADARFRETGALHITKSGGVYTISPPQGRNKQLHLWFYPAGFGPGMRRDAGVIGGSALKPTAINDAGTVVGTWDTGEVRNKTALHRAFLWHKGDRKWLDLGTFGGSQSEAAGVNDAGQVAGTADLPDDPTTHRFRAHAFLWEKGAMKDLGALPGGYLSHAYAINDRGQIVGFSEVTGNGMDFRPVLWERSGMKDLSLLIPAGTPWAGMGGAEGINDKGQIVGDGSVMDSHDHHIHGYLLTPR